ncbi:TetR family transcriptional regulator [Alicyclobacillus contaminans]|uniref:TetR/AcrR family transcriptional regulator n=1 Tax=Alicyclobacillus contaminans TaxID=392016 RepID=UPI00040E6ECF|nr:TetR/AcrR family transcriptional regulator [Alicyclobacillus contaminans]GMA49477.1 TetR family transcriptional regulator [Alicyclobacillus contaminans]
MGVQIGSNVKDPERIRERRRQIVEAAVQLFSEKGFHKTTTREIARASGLSNGALYEYVTSKEDILFLVCQHIHQEIFSRLAQTVTTATHGAERLKTAIEGLFDVMHDMQADVLLIYQEAKSLPKLYLTEVLRHEQEIVAWFEQQLRHGVADGTLGISEEQIPLLAQDIVVMGQMWAFRRWALKGISFSQFRELQIRMLMAAASGSTASAEVSAQSGRRGTLQ